MPKKITLKPHLTTNELYKCYRAQPSTKRKIAVAGFVFDFIRASGSGSGTSGRADIGLGNTIDAAL